MLFETSTIRLRNGESIGMGAIEIASIPDISLLQEGQTTEAVYASLQNGIVRLLSELHQTYRQYRRRDGRPADMAAELLWKTAPVQNQPYEAAVQLFFIARAIDLDEESAKANVEALLKTAVLTLDAFRFEYRSVPTDALTALPTTEDPETVLCVRREERVENLQNQMMPSCFAFDRIAPAPHDMTKLMGTLIHCPNCAVSMQLVLTQFSQAEADAIGQTAQMLGSVSRGIAGAGTEVTLADRSLALYKYYAANVSGAAFQFAILVAGKLKDARLLAASTFGQINGDPSMPLNMQTVQLRRDRLRRDDNFYPHPWVLQQQLCALDRRADIAGSAYGRLPYLITVEEAASLFTLPIGSPGLTAGMTINLSRVGSKEFSDNLINAGDIPFGRLRSSAGDDRIGLSLKDLTRHMLIVGTPGSGKTTFSVGMLDQLWKKHHIPFLVIEPAKTEYRALVQSIPELQIFTPGKSGVSPFLFNPFIPPKNVRLEAYKSVLKTAFSAAVSMASPLDKIFEESIHNCYSDFHWLDSYTVDDGGKIFNISDFIRCFEKTFESIGYRGDAQNIGRAGVVRLNGLRRLFDNYATIPIEDLLTKPTVIELAAVENSDEKALIIALILLSVLSYVNANYLGDGKLKNVLLLEEAHVLLDSDSESAQGEANPSGIAKGLVRRMLAEIRSYGVGMVIADQSPRKVTSDIVGLTDIKMAFRLVEAADREILAESTGMDERQRARLPRLRPGEAFLFFHRLDEPEEIVTDDYRLEHNIDITLSDESIRDLSAYWKGREQLLRPYPECAFTPYCTERCDMARRQLSREVARRIYMRYLTGKPVSVQTLGTVFTKISALVKEELGDIPFSRQLLSCVKLHLLRRVKYSADIRNIDQIMRNALMKE